LLQKQQVIVFKQFGRKAIKNMFAEQKTRENPKNGKYRVSKKSSISQ
jgi:hypothetical protein